MDNLGKYLKAIEFVKHYIQYTLKDLECNSAVVYGSSTLDGGFIDGHSDIDICAFTDKVEELGLDKILEYVVRTTHADFIDKKPTILCDSIADRVEFYIRHYQISLDITITTSKIIKNDDICDTSVYDSFDVLLGALYEHSIVLFGELPYYHEIKNNYFPFYSDEIRRKRLIVLSSRIKRYNSIIELLLKEKNYDLIDYLFKSRSYFFKWLFIYERKYPISLSKHIGIQLSSILNLPKQEIETLMLAGKGDIFNSTKQYLNLVDDYLNKY